MTLNELNRSTDAERRAAALLRVDPVGAADGGRATLRERAGDDGRGRRVWRALDPPDWLEAFAAHPRIGERAADPWAAREQAGAAGAEPPSSSASRRANREYEARFGYIFIVCASGKTADQMLRIAEQRLTNDPHRGAARRRRGAAEHLASQAGEADGIRMITTHVLDTSRGGPAAGVTVILEMRHASEWSPVGRGHDRRRRPARRADRHQPRRARAPTG